MPVSYPVQRQQAFTLIELLIVVALIGILTAIAVPWFADYRDQARQSSVLHDLRTCLTETAADLQNNTTPDNCYIGEAEGYADNPFINEQEEIEENPAFAVAGYQFEFNGRQIKLLE